jgi:hypothetical protein
MKFLITATPNSTPMPAGEKAARLYQIAEEWVDVQMEEGIVECIYSFPQGGGFSISNLDSHEALLAHILDYPLYSYFTFDVKPLVDQHAKGQKYIERARRMAKE